MNYVFSQKRVWSWAAEIYGCWMPRLQRLWNFQVSFCAVLGSMVFWSFLMFPENVSCMGPSREMQLAFFPHAEWSGKKQPHYKGVMFGALSHTVSIPYLKYGLWIVRCASGHLKPSLSLRFPLQEAWTIGRSNMSSYSWPSGGMSVSEIHSLGKPFKAAWTYSTVLNIGHPSHLLQWRIMVYKIFCENL